jgi:hypothetical protein
VEFCHQSSVQIFNTYLQCHLSPPDGRRGVGKKDLKKEEIDGNEEDDRSKYKEQLQAIGCIRITFFRPFIDFSLFKIQYPLILILVGIYYLKAIIVR